MQVCKDVGAAMGQSEIEQCHLANPRRWAYARSSDYMDQILYRGSRRHIYIYTFTIIYIYIYAYIILRSVRHSSCAFACRVTRVHLVTIDESSKKNVTYVDSCMHVQDMESDLRWHICITQSDFRWHTKRFSLAYKAILAGM